MLLDGRIITDGVEIIGYLDEKLEAVRKANHTATGIIIGSRARKFLSEACMRVMEQDLKDKEDVTVNRFRGVLLIEDGVNEDRVEVIHGKAPIKPVEGNPFAQLKRVGR